MLSDEGMRVKLLMPTLIGVYILGGFQMVLFLY